MCGIQYDRRTFRQFFLTERAIPKGLRPSAQGCEERATLGQDSENENNPNGVVAISRAKGGMGLAATPLGLAMFAGRRPKVVPLSRDNIWLCAAAPLGLVEERDSASRSRFASTETVGGLHNAIARGHAAGHRPAVHRTRECALILEKE